MKNFYLFFLLVVFAGCCNSANAQNISNEGSEFWLAFATHDPSGNNLAQMNVNVTAKENTEVTVSCGNYTETQEIPANTVVVFQVPRTESYVDYNDRNQLLPNRGIHVLVAPGKPNVSVYSHVYASARSAASLILPIGALGQKYYSMNYTQDQSVVNKIPARNFLLIVATETNTKVLIHTKNGQTIPVILSGIGDVYEYVPDGLDDLTGTFVEVDESTDSKCKKFAAYSGSTSILIYNNSSPQSSCGNSRDPLFQQLYPINSWGKNYGVIPFYNRNYILRILAQEDNTSVNVGGSTIMLNKGGFYEVMAATTPIMISADKLISVAQYSLTQGCSAVNGGLIQGDPEMVLLNPIEFNINKITLFSATRNAIAHKYLNIFMRTDKTSSFKVNGKAPANGTWSPMPSDPTYSYIQIEVGIGISEEESLTLTAGDGFNAIAYGFGEAESYAYSAGTNLASSQFLTILNKVTNEVVTSACTGQEVEFKLTMPYLLSKIDWNFSDGSSYSYNAPTYTQSVVNGVTVYTYKLEDKRTFLATDTIKLKVTGNLSIGAQVCGSSTNYEFDYDLYVVPLPTAKIDAPASSCFGDEVQFKDLSSTNVPGKIITKWLWDFDDPNSGASSTSDQPDPKHLFSTPGKHIVKLMAGSEDGCLSEVKTFEIFINIKPEAKFNQDLTKTCIATDIKFTDISTVIDGNIIKWTWDFGDPSAGTSNTSNLKNATHAYPRAGKYNVTLTVETDRGCSKTSASREIEITGPITSDFKAPDVCVSDPVTEFENTSTNADGTTAGLTYEWDFGDPLATPALNKSTEINGKHAYTKADHYTVTLTVRNQTGCVDIKTQEFTVNGKDPVADFEVINRDNLCSNMAFMVKNKSSVDFGSITKLVWYVNGVEYIDNDPVPLKEYPFTIPESTSDTPVELIMIAYSGGICASTPHIDNFILHASPQVKFDALADICLDEGPRQLIASQQSTLNGAAAFSGKGVTADGIFNPRIAGVGTHAITYTFQTDKGCNASITQSITVNPIPTVNGGGDFYILSGGQKQIPATAIGIGLTYKWSPSAGLSRDDILNPIASPEQTTKYTLTVTSNKGCTTTEQLYVYVLQNIEAPNTFTPNGDGVNDVWNVKYLDTYPNATVEIYDRNGQKVFASMGYTKPFDGFYQNQPLPVGTYYYIISPNSGRKRVTGNVTIIR